MLSFTHIRRHPSTDEKVSATQRNIIIAGLSVASWAVLISAVLGLRSLL